MTSKDQVNTVIVDRDGNNPLQMLSMGALSEGLAAARFSNGLFGYVNERQEIIIQPQYSIANSFSKGTASVMLNDRWLVINSAGNDISAPAIQQIPNSQISTSNQNVPIPKITVVKQTPRMVKKPFAKRNIAAIIIFTLMAIAYIYAFYRYSLMQNIDYEYETNSYNPETDSNTTTTVEPIYGNTDTAYITTSADTAINF